MRGLVSHAQKREDDIFQTIESNSGSLEAIMMSPVSGRRISRRCVVADASRLCRIPSCLFHPLLQSLLSCLLEFFADIFVELVRVVEV